MKNHWPVPHSCSSRPKLYYAAPLFSEAERAFNEHVASKLNAFFDVYLPQEDGGLLIDMVSKGMDPQRAARAVFNMDIIALQKCDILLIVLDGRTVDEGAAFELGYAHALGIFCCGLQTDPRRLLKIGNNPMIDCALQDVFTTVYDLLIWAQGFTQEKRTTNSSNLVTAQ